MNKYFAIFGNKVTTIDETGLTKNLDASENIEGILIKENEIEEIENQLKEINKKKLKTREDLQHDKQKIKQALLFGIFAGFAGLLAVVTYFFYTGTFKLLTSVGEIISCIFLSQMWYLRYYLDYIASKRFLQMTKFLSYYLKKEISIKQLELEKLKENDKKLEFPIEQLELKKVDDRKVLLDLRWHLEVLKDYGETLTEQANKYAKGFWGEEDREKITQDGLNVNWYENYITEYNARKLMKTKDKKIS